MKKLSAIILTLLFLCASLVMTVSADSYNYSGSWDYQFTLKKADPANVVKDGRIGDGEYEKLDVITDPEVDGNMFWVAYTDSDMYDYAEAMLKTMEYYFSWDDTHGFNLAVRCKPHELKQLLVEGADKDKPMDYFLQNTGFQIDLYSKEHRDHTDFTDVLYYAIARRTDNGEYLRGHWGQFGVIGSYDPVPGEDFVIEYDFSTGYVVCEWSVPISAFIRGDIGAGTDIFFSFAVTGGTIDSMDPAQNGDPKDMYAVGLGDYCYLCKRGKDSTYITATLSDEIIPGGGQNEDVTPVTPDDPAYPDGPSNPSDPSNPAGPSNPADPSNPSSPADPEAPVSGGKSTKVGSSTKTGDIVFVLTAVSAMSAAGAFFSGKRRGRR